MAIGKRTFQSAGQSSQHLIPGAYSRIDSVKGATSLVSNNNVVIMGQGQGGKPATLLQLNSIADATNILKGGALMDAVRMAFNPGNDLVPQRLYAMRVNTATISTYSMLKGADPMIKVDSLDYGLSQNQITLAVAAGTTVGKKITVGYKTDTETFDDVIRNSITITHAAATGTVTNTSALHQLVLSVGPLTIDFNTYTTIGDLAAYINLQAGYSAVVAAGQENASTLELDGTGAIALAAGGVFQSTMQAVIDKLNNESNFVEASAVNAAVNRGIPDNFTTKYMPGGSEGSYTAAEWTAALLALEAEDIQFVATPDSDAAAHSSIKTHCESMSSVTGRKERQFLVGGVWGEAVATATTAAGTLNSRWGMRVFNGFQQYDSDYVLTNYPSAYTACLLAGMCGAQAINAPLTFKKLNVIALEDKLTNTELETCIENGVCPVNYSSQNIPHIVRQVNTYQTDDLKWNEFSMVKEMAFVSRDLRSYLESMFVGMPGNSLTGGVLRGAVQAKLEQYVDLGVFSRDSNGVAWWNVIITISGDTVNVDYDAYLTAPINFIFVTNHMHVIVSTA